MGHLLDMERLFSLACLRTGGATAHFRRHRNLGRHGLQLTGLFLTGLVRGLAMNAWSLWTRVQHLDTAVVGSFAQAWQPPPPPYTTPSLPPLYLNQSSSDGFPNHVDPWGYYWAMFDGAKTVIFGLASGLVLGRTSFAPAPTY